MTFLFEIMRTKDKFDDAHVPWQKSQRRSWTVIEIDTDVISCSINELDCSKWTNFNDELHNKLWLESDCCYNDSFHPYWYQASEFNLFCGILDKSVILSNNLFKSPQAEWIFLCLAPYYHWIFIHLLKKKPSIGFYHHFFVWGRRKGKFDDALCLDRIVKDDPGRL